MSRVSDSELRELVEAKAEETLTSYIDDANLLVNETLGINSGLTDGRLKLVEKYLAAHLWVISKEKGGLTGEVMGDAEATYAKSEGTGLSATRFGRQVIIYDTTGLLDKVLTAGRKAQFRLV